MHTLNKPFTHLTPRQRQILRGAWNGVTNQAMAVQLGISRRTVENHRATLMLLLGAHNVAQLFRAAAKAGLLDLEED